jgi:hypothetical protein
MKRSARPWSRDNQPGDGMPEGISVLVPLGCDAKTGGFSDEYGEIAPMARRRRQEAAKSQDLLGQEERPPAGIAPA